MTDYVRVNIDEGAVEAMFRDWSSPVGLYIADLTQRAEDTAKVIAPVSPKGSKYAPPGYLKSRIVGTTEHYTDDKGYVLGLVGIPLRAGSRYPYPFVNNPSGKTWNKGHRTFRRAMAKFLNEALAAAVNRGA